MLDGLNLTRIDEFCDKYKIRKVPIVYCSEQNFQKADKILNPDGIEEYDQRKDPRKF